MPDPNTSATLDQCIAAFDEIVDACIQHYRTIVPIIGRESAITMISATIDQQMQLRVHREVSTLGDALSLTSGIAATAIARLCGDLTEVTEVS